MSKILSIDYGERRIGIAISDDDQIIATRLPIIKVKDTKESIPKLTEVVEQFKPSALLFGLPLDAEGNETNMSKKIKTLATELHFSYKPTVLFRNEFYSSMYSMEMSKDHKFTRKQFDSEVARRILQEHLDDMQL